MKIFLTVSRTGMQKYQKNYEKILAELNRCGVDVFATFVRKYADQLEKYRKGAKTETARKYANDTAIRREISKADAVVIEASYPSFRLGFETFYALSLQKPVLVLAKDRDYSSLIDQPHFFGARYSDFTLPDEIEKFLRHVKENRLRTRFNLFISDKHREKLSARAKHFGVSMSDYVRKLIEKDLNF